MKKYILNLSIFSLIIWSVSCSIEGADSAFGTGDAISGSYATMLTLNENLYVLGNGKIQVLDISNKSNPEEKGAVNVTPSIETIFYNGSNLFIGSQEGMFIYSLDDQGLPILESETSYEDFVEVLPCDPIVANSSHAYVTLSTSVVAGGPCFRFTQLNELNVFDINDVQSPVRLTSVPMSEPKGLGLDGDVLFVCEANNGVKAFDVSNPSSPELFYTSEQFSAYDVIPKDGLLMVVGQDTIHQFDYTDIENIEKISTFAILD